MVISSSSVDDVAGIRRLGPTGRPMEPDDRPDTELLAAHVAGDPWAFGTLIRRHERHLWAVARRTTGDPDDAADALQDALLQAHRTAHRFRGDAQVRTWLHRLVVNACLDRLRRRRRTMPLPGGDAPVPPARIDHADRLDITSALAALPPHQRAAIVAVDVEGLSVVDAADRLGVAPGTIKSRRARGRATLAITLGHLRSA